MCVDFWEIGMPKQCELRLILGLGRSGTTWLSSAINQTESSIRFSMEGLLAFRPKVKLAPFKDRSAAPFLASIDKNHPLASFYGAVSAFDFDVAQSKMEGPIVRNDPAPQCTIVKEVHALLATEAVINYFKCPTAIITRDPLRIIDSLFARDGYQSHYLNRETGELLGSRFVKEFRRPRTFLPRSRHARSELLDRYFAGRETQIQSVADVVKSKTDPRTRIVLAKIVTAGLISEMLRQIASANSCCRHISYEELCEQPFDTVCEVANDFGIECGDKVRTFLRESTSRKTNKADRFPVYRNQCQIGGQPFRFLTDLEVDLGRSLLAEIEATPTARVT